MAHVLPRSYQAVLTQSAAAVRAYLWYKHPMARAPLSQHAPLVRAIGRWSMVALAVNSILGSGIFGLPSAVAALVGAASPLAMLLAGGATGVIIACYAEVGRSLPPPAAPTCICVTRSGA